MKYLLFITLIFWFKNCNIVYSMHPHVGLTEYQIMTKYGYPYEKHYVTTKDGYILEIARILPQPDSIKQQNNITITSKVYPELLAKTPNEPILLMPGILSNAAAFVINDVDKALGFILVNHGYDVFLGNPRGSTRSRRHVSLDPDVNSKEFWDYSWHEMGVFDLPAMVDYILKLTGFKQLSYVGHSQGGTSFYVMAAARPETNAKIKIGINFGPVCFMRHTPTTIARRIAKLEEKLQKMLDRLEIYEFLRYATVFQHLAKIFGDDEFGLKEILEQTMNTVNIITTYNMDVDLIPVLASSSPSGVSIKQVGHYLQNINNGEFRMYDYHNEVKNMEKYGYVVPPRYNLSAITCKSVLYYSNNDFFVHGKDAQLLCDQVSTAIPVEIKIDKFSHTDYLWSRNIMNFMYKDLLFRLNHA